MGVAGANYYARSGATMFTTEDRDLFLPPEPSIVLRAWKTCASLGLDLRSGDEPLGRPLDMVLARRVVSRRALVRATQTALQVDLALVMAGFTFETVWGARRIFKVHGVGVPVARLSHIVRSKAAAGRLKDRLFLASHEEALRDLMGGRKARRHQ